MTFSLIHPSIRPNKWREIYDAWIRAAKRPENVEYLLALDEKWGFVKSFDFDGEMSRWVALRYDSTPQTDWAGMLNQVFWVTGEGYVKSVNLAAKEANADVLIVIADDLWPCVDWDEAILEQIKLEPAGEEISGPLGMHPVHAFPKEFAIWVNNGDRHIGSRGDIMAMPVVSRSRVERLGYLYYPKYLSMYADQDLAEHCMLDAEKGRCSLIVMEQPVFPHAHPANDPSVPVDDAYKWQNRPQAYAVGKKILEARRAAKFGEIELAAGKKRIAISVTGDSFCIKWLECWTAMTFTLSGPYDLDCAFGFQSSNVYQVRMNQARNIRQLEADYVIWIDNDQLYSAEHVKRLIQDLEENPEIDMVAGWTVCGVDVDYTAPQISCAFPGPPKVTTAKDFPEGDLVQVKWTGFPLAAMRGSLLEELGPEAFKPLDGDTEWGFYGEDVSFCLRAGVAGKKIFVDKRVGPLPHLKLRDIAAVVR